MMINTNICLVNAAPGFGGKTQIVLFKSNSLFIAAFSRITFNTV